MPQENFVPGFAEIAIAALASWEIVKLDCGKHSHIWKGRVQTLAHEVLAMIKTMTMTVDKLNLSKWNLADVTTSSKGQKTSQLTNDHKPIVFHLGARLRTRFGASSFDKNVESSRNNLDFDVTSDK